MKAILLCLFFSTILAIVSCKKDSTNNTSNSTSINNSSDSFSIPLGTITADVEGVPTDFSLNAIADTGYTPDFSIDIKGFSKQKANSKTENGVSGSIEIWLSREFAQPIGLKNFWVGSYPYLYNNGPTHVEVDGAVYYDTTQVYDNPIGDFQMLYNRIGVINIISITDSAIKGTFTCDMVRVEGSEDPMQISVTNGKFYVPVEP